MATHIDHHVSENVAESIATPNGISSVREDYASDGAALLRQVIPTIWLDRLAEGTERLLTNAPSEADFNREGEGRFFGDIYASMRIPEYRDFIEHSGIGRLVGEIMGSQTVRFFYDQPLVKEPGTPKPTPWHHDSSYWPCSGRQIMSVWVPLDPATSENGVVRYVKGSHKWNAFYPVEAWSDKVYEVFDSKPGDRSLDEDPGPGASRQQPRTIADIRDHPERYDLTDWSVEPGDVLVHQMDTIHGAPGNSSQTMRRRAIAFRFLGDDARWDDTHPHFLRMLKRMDPEFPYPALKTGDPIEDPLFPVIWSRTTS